ncbi:7-alpha-hydroxysteroid dehydrogenase [Rhodobacteraceae bacterium MBR-64]|jgi:7-alpha-hydroxysteroid dehydrogenase
MTFSVAGKTAIVTGAANGVGLAIARKLADSGCRVMFADMDEARLAAEMGSNPGENIRSFGGDLRQKLTLANLISATVDAFERVDILVNASRQVTLSDPICAEDDAVEAMLQQNLLPSLRLSQMVARRMIAQAQKAEDSAACIGTIVNLSSIAARRTTPELMGYSISCAALDQMTRSLAVALAPRRIRVNAVAIGSVMSASLKDALRDHDEFRDDILCHTPLARIGTAAEVAEAVQFLASDGAGFMTGQILTVDGGRTLLDPVASPTH